MISFIMIIRQSHRIVKLQWTREQDDFVKRGHQTRMARETFEVIFNIKKNIETLFIFSKSLLPLLLNGIFDLKFIQLTSTHTFTIQLHVLTMTTLQQCDDVESYDTELIYSTLMLQNILSSQLEKKNSSFNVLISLTFREI